MEDEKPTQEISDFAAMDIMAARDMDIALCPSIHAIDITQNGGKVTIGVPADAAHKISTGTHYAVLYVVNKDQFKAIKKS
jgi:hypothetical protein